MVQTTILLKMLHNNGIGWKKNNIEHHDLHEKPSREVTVKIEQVECDEQNICRVCLKEGNVPIYGYSNGFDDICDALNTFGGILVSVDDEYPKYLCHSCNAFLQESILFRKTAQETEKVLRQRSQDTTISESITSKIEGYTYKLEDVKIEDNNPKGYQLENDEPEDHKLEDGKIDNSKLEDGADVPFCYQMEVVYDNKKVNKQKKYHCKKCDLNFHTKYEYSVHKSCKDHKNMRVTCKICKKTYKSSYIRKHLKLHNCETYYVCDICGKNFKGRCQFQSHRLIHFNDLPFKCSLCPYRGRFKASLKLHMMSHTGEKPYKCSQCPHCCLTKSNLNRHMLLHKAHDFKCNQCPKKFRTKKTMDLHIKTIHRGIRDHVCDDCGKAYSSKRMMMKHQLAVHNREKVRHGRTPLWTLLKQKQDDKDN